MHILKITYTRAKRENTDKSKKSTSINLPIQPIGSRFVMDVFGPHLVSDNNRYILTVIDTSSQWPEWIPIRDQQAETTINALFEHVVSRHGIPRSMSFQSDLGSNFISKLAEQFCKTF